MTPSQWVNVAISVLAPPIVYTAFFRWLLRAKISNLHMILSFVWGLVAYGISSLLTSLILVNVLRLGAVIHYAIPVQETLLASLYVFWLLYRRQIPDYLAGAAYGAAIEVAFAMLDNVSFFTGGQAVRPVTAVISRLLTVSNMYGVSGAMLGFGMGMTRFEQSQNRKTLWVVGGLVASAVWHSMYANLVSAVQVPELFVDTAIFAAGGIGLMVALIRSTQARHVVQALQSEKKRADDLINVVIPLGVSLSSERDFTRMLETIVEQGRAFANADGGSLYLRTGADTLEAVVVSNQRLGIFARGTGTRELIIEPQSLFEADGKPSHATIAATVVNEGSSLNIPDVYTSKPEFPGPKDFDRKMNYRTTSCLCVPLKNEAGKPIGALQLVNARSPLTQDAVPFEASTQLSLESLSALASVALTSYVRTEALREEIYEFKIDQAKVASHVSEITDSEFFSTLKERVKKVSERRAAAPA